MSKAFKAASSVGAVALVLSGAAMAASPTGAFNGWSVTSGVIAPTVACPTGFSCATAVTGDGFYQRQITDSLGNDYFQTIITDKGVTGSPTANDLTFSDENYVRTGNVSGLADKTQMKEVVTSGTLTTTFEGSTELGTGWANGGTPGTDDTVQIYQGIIANDTAVGAEDFDAKFWLRQTGAEGATGKRMRISSGVDIQESTSQPGTQDFVLVELSGNENTAIGTANLGTAGSVTWAAGDRIKAIWVGQDMAAISGVNQEFGYTSYEDFTGTTGAASTFSLLAGASTAPVDWTVGTWGGSHSTDAGPF